MAAEPWFDPKQITYAGGLINSKFGEVLLRVQRSRSIEEDDLGNIAYNLTLLIKEKFGQEALKYWVRKVKKNDGHEKEYKGALEDIQTLVVSSPHGTINDVATYRGKWEIGAKNLTGAMAMFLSSFFKALKVGGKWIAEVQASAKQV